METKYQILSLFPTPIYVNNIPEGVFGPIISDLENEPIIESKASETNGDKSKNSYILNQGIYSNFSKYVLQHATHFAENILSFNYKDYKFSQSWVSIKRPNQSHTPHIHTNSLISGVFYWEDYNDESHLINFHKSDSIPWYGLNHHPQKPEEELNDFSYTKISIPPSKGTLLLFRSDQIHSVSKNTTSENRKSLAFNINPQYGFGQEKNLNELKFN